MYKIDVLSSGKYDNVVVGTRYCLTKRIANDLIKRFLMFNCIITVRKLIKMTTGVYGWSMDHDLYDGTLCIDTAQYSDPTKEDRYWSILAVLEGKHLKEGEERIFVKCKSYEEADKFMFEQFKGEHFYYEGMYENEEAEEVGYEIFNVADF